MGDIITSRQTQILKHLIDEYIETAQPVGSEALDKKYDLGISPATIRNEMSELSKLGYIKQPHTSAGRVPTPKGMRFYITQLMQEKRMPLTEEVGTKEDFWERRSDMNSLMSEVTRKLAQKTRALAIATTSEGNVWHAGYSNLFNQPEFQNFHVSASVFSLIEEIRRLHQLFFEYIPDDHPVEVLFGEDLSWPYFEPIGIVATRCSLGSGQEAALGVIGSLRLDYPVVVPTLRYFGELVEEALARPK